MSEFAERLQTFKALDAGEYGEHLLGIGTAVKCNAAGRHSPKPLRYVWHHILPVACGGLAVVDNLVSLCDSCHFAIHAMLTDLKVNGKLVTYQRYSSTTRAKLARQGYAAAVAAGTVDKIPNEGAST